MMIFAIADAQVNHPQQIDAIQAPACPHCRYETLKFPGGGVVPICAPYTFRFHSPSRSISNQSLPLSLGVASLVSFASHQPKDMLDGPIKRRHAHSFPPTREIPPYRPVATLPICISPSAKYRWFSAAVSHSENRKTGCSCFHSFCAHTFTGI